jgi:hypothetical protein
MRKFILPLLGKRIIIIIIIFEELGLLACSGSEFIF